MPAKCKFMVPCSNKKCKNTTKCPNFAKKSGYCSEHTPVGGSGGVEVTTHYGDGDWLIPHINKDGTDWLGMKTSIR